MRPAWAGEERQPGWARQSNPHARRTVRSSDFFTEETDPFSSVNGDPWATTTSLAEGLLVAIRQGPIAGTSDISAALGLLDLVHQELEAYGTGGGEKLTDEQLALAIRALQAVARRVGRPLELPFRNFTTFRSYWSRNGASGSGGWQARRDIIEGLLEPVRRELIRLEESPVRPQIREEAIANLRDPAAIQEQLARIQRAVIVDDPALVIGSAKELVESTAKAVLIERGWPVNEGDKLPALVSQAQRALALHPSSTTPGPDGSDAVKKILGGMTTVTAGLAELRNRGYGTGHGPAGARVGLRVRHAHLAVNASVTWCQLMLDTLADEAAPWRQNPPVS
jgi:hypothetical protein